MARRELYAPRRMAIAMRPTPMQCVTHYRFFSGVLYIYSDTNAVGLFADVFKAGMGLTQLIGVLHSCNTPLNTISNKRPIAPAYSYVPTPTNRVTHGGMFLLRADISRVRCVASDVVWRMRPTHFIGISPISYGKIVIFYIKFKKSPHRCLP